MIRLIVLITSFWLVVASAAVAAISTPEELRDLYLGETLYYAFQQDWFDAIARLDTELVQHHQLDQPQLDSLFPHIGLAEFAVGDFELSYRMHRRAGRAITAVINGNVAEEVRNEAIYRLGKIYFQKAQPVNALHALERVSGKVPEMIEEDLTFLRAQVLMATGNFNASAELFSSLRGSKKFAGFAGYNLGISLLLEGDMLGGLRQLDQTGQGDADEPMSLGIRDKANLVLGDRLLGAGELTRAKEVLDRVRLNGPFSNRALLGSGWADASREDYAHALVPWTLLLGKEITDPAVQEGLLAAPYAYGKLGIYSRAALLYSQALQVFNSEIDKLSASIINIREGKFLKALLRDELQQDANWVVKLRELPESPETYYLLELMASHDFQESLQNYLDLESLRRKLENWSRDLDAFEELIDQRRQYYQPLLPSIDSRFRELDSQMRLRIEQRDHIERRLQGLLTAARPDDLATAGERIVFERLRRLERQLVGQDGTLANRSRERIGRLRGLLTWTIHTDYDRRLTVAHQNLYDLNQDIEHLSKQYKSFVRIRQAATQSYHGYDATIRRQRAHIAASSKQVETLMARQGHMLEALAVTELNSRRERLEEFQVKARFAMADSYDRAARKQGEERHEE
jgi:hypothetical protein